MFQDTINTLTSLLLHRFLRLVCLKPLTNLYSLHPLQFQSIAQTRPHTLRSTRSCLYPSVSNLVKTLLSTGISFLGYLTNILYGPKHLGQDFDRNESLRIIESPPTLEHLGQSQRSLRPF